MPIEDTHVVQVTNVSPAVTRDQLKTLFAFIGKIDDIKLYPELEAIDVSTRVCYIKFKEAEDVGVALHLTNTVFVDRAVIVVPVPDDKIPDELTALGLAGTDEANPSNMYQGLAQYPVLPANTELSKVEEIRRTIYVGNIDCTVTPEILMQFFTQAGEIKYMRMAGDESFPIRNAYVEYADQNSVVKALGLNGQTLAGHQIRVTPSNSAIVKPPILPGVSATTKEIEEAMKKVNEAESLISAVVDPLTNGSRRSRSKHRSRSRRSRSRSRRSRRSRSRGSHSKRRSVSRTRKYRSRSRRRSRSRSHKRSRRRSRSGSRSRRSRSRRSKSRERRTRDCKPSKSRRSKSRDKVKYGESKSASDRDVSTSSRNDREESVHSGESKSRSSKKEPSKRKSESTSKRSRSRSRSKKSKKSRHHDSDKTGDEKKPRKEDKSSHKRKDAPENEDGSEKAGLARSKKKSHSDKHKSSGKESSYFGEGSSSRKAQKAESGSEDGGGNSKCAGKDDVDCAQMDMDVDSE